MTTLHSVIGSFSKNVEPPKQIIHILHVDDEEGFLKSAKQILEMQDLFQVETASSVKEAIQKMEKNSFDLIVSDYQMPEKSGMDFLKELRKNGNKIPFILFTGKGREEIAIDALNLGADYYFNKSGTTETVYGELAHGIRAVVKAKKAEEKLKASEKTYRLLTENITDTIFIQDMNLNVTYVSRSVETLTGYTPEEVYKLRPDDFMTPESFERGVADFKEAIALTTEKPDAEIPLKQYEYIREDGSTFWGELKTKLLRDSEGRLVGVQGTLRDITERKKAEDALRKEREMLELVTANIGAGLTIISKDYKILWANKFLEQICGDVIGKTCYSLYNDRTSVCPGCGVKEIFELGKDQVVHEQSVPGPNGKRVWIELTANPVRDEKGNIIAASEVSVNLNDRKEMERKLREAEKRYHALFDKAPLGILIIDSNATAIEFNDEAHRQLGYSREEFEKLTVSDYEVLETADETRARMRKVLKAGKDEFETKHRTKNGEIRDIINTVQMIELDGKQFFHIITRDITERKKAEESLDKMMKELVAINEKLGVVGKLTRHDVRNKLSVIANKVYLSKQQLAGGHDSLECLSDIESAIDQIDQIFSFARTYEMLGADELSYVNVKKFVDEAVMLFSGMNRVKLVTNCDGLTVLADSLLWQLFYNLIDNSLKHGEKVTQIRVYYKEAEDQLKLIYEDNGVGIPKDEKEKIFRERYGKGTGYGLYLIRKMCDAYGWTIKETGKRGKGAQFTMTIPKMGKGEKTTYSLD